MTKTTKAAKRATSYELNTESAAKVLWVVDQGLVAGLGVPEPGKLCVEAAVCFAMGLPHSDEPLCVGAAVRRFKIRLNDANWSSNEARTAGMRKLAIAQLGSETINQQAFAKLVAEATIRRLVPEALRIATKTNPAHAEKLEAAAQRCEAEGTEASARAAADAANAANAANAAYAAADAANAANAANAAYAAAYAAYAAANAANAADAAAYAARDRILNICADIGLQALIALKSPGCEYLHLCEVSP